MPRTTSSDRDYEPADDIESEDAPEDWAGSHELKIDPEFAGLLGDLSDEELKALRADVLVNGCLDPIKVWDGVIVDGHNRYAICQEHGISFKVKRMYFDDRAEAMQWMYEHQRGRRNWTAQREQYVRGTIFAETVQAHPEVGREKLRQEVAAKEGVTPRTLHRNEQYAAALDAVGKDAPEVKSKVLDGELKLSGREIRELAEAPPEVRRQANESAKAGKPIKAPKESKPSRSLAVSDAVSLADSAISKAMRCVDDLNRLAPSANHKRAIQLLRDASDEVREWK